MKSPELIFHKADIHDHVRSLWKTEHVKRSYDTGGLVYRIVDKFARLPRFFYEMSDEYLERAHFSIWWSGTAYRRYDKPSCNDLYLLHEFAHGADMIHAAGQHEDAFKRKMQDNELQASVTTEVMAYFDMPELRAMTFAGEIYADRFLKDKTLHQRWKDDPERLTSELYYRRRHAMFWPDKNDPIEMWLHHFTAQNEKWFAVWRRDFEPVEIAMEKLTRLTAEGKREEALLRHVDWLYAQSDNGVPFRRHAEDFAKIYWEGRPLPDAKAA